MAGEPGSTLAELRVLDLSDGVAGGYCGKLFADYGADVLKVETPSGDPTRRHGPFPASGGPHREVGALWLYLGTNKRSVTLDISQPTGQRLLRRLVEDVHVIVESFPPGHLQSLGLGFEALRSIKRRIVLVSITPYGQSGPKAGWRATNLTSFASGGQMSLTGEPDREPLVNAGYQAEYQAGLQAFAAAAVAAHQADVSEVPQHVDISAQECMASVLELYLPWWAYLKRDISKRGGNVLSSMVGAARVPTAFVHTLADLLQSEQLRAREYFHEVDHPTAGRQTSPGPPFRMSEVQWRAGRAPLLGEHNREVYCGELGLSAEGLARLRAAGVV
jgi:crotonobetainyl-CoA:carnitine CoA-transferase CaiB-like acyl-CoA transferase